MKGLKKENLRDNMTNLELVLNTLAETATTEISRKEGPEGLNQSKEIANRGGRIANNTKKHIESEIGKPIITSKNFKPARQNLLRGKDKR